MGIRPPPGGWATHASANAAAEFGNTPVPNSET
jgi:hypothetical protein